MAPLGFLTASVSSLARSFSVLSCTSPLARCARVPLAANIRPAKCLSSQPSGPPKKPANGYLLYVQKHQPMIFKLQPELKPNDVIRKIALQWRTLSPEEKRPFEVESQKAMEQFKADLHHYQAQLTPAQLKQELLINEQRKAKRMAIRKKRELNTLGKPKRPRSAFNIFMSEHFQEARGTTIAAKMASLLEDWNNLLSNQKQTYTQLAEDDKIRYTNEIQSWEKHMVEIGRQDLVRLGFQASLKKATKLKKLPASGKSTTTSASSKASRTKKT